MIQKCRLQNMTLDNLVDKREKPWERGWTLEFFISVLQYNVLLV